jgi:hypothetical protein
MLGRVVHFVKRIKKKMEINNFFKLNKLQIELLNDKAFSPEANNNCQRKRRQSKKVIYFVNGSKRGKFVKGKHFVKN